jgi:hypothetical protein
MRHFHAYWVFAACFLGVLPTAAQAHRARHSRYHHARYPHSANSSSGVRAAACHSTRACWWNGEIQHETCGSAGIVSAELRGINNDVIVYRWKRHAGDETLYYEQGDFRLNQHGVCTPGASGASSVALLRDTPVVTFFGVAGDSFRLADLTSIDDHVIDIKRVDPTPSQSDHHQSDIYRVFMGRNADRVLTVCWSQSRRLWTRAANEDATNAPSSTCSTTAGLVQHRPHGRQGDLR